MKKYFAFVSLGVLFFSSCTTVIFVRSSWENNNIIIDGDEKDWKDRTFYLNEQNVSLGVRNDQENFYFFMKIIDRQRIRNIHAAGLTIWLDPNGDNGKKYGIRIPKKPMRMGEMQEGDSQILQNDINEVEIFTKGKKEPMLISIAELKGIQFASTQTFETLILEFKIPLKDTAENPLHWNVTNNEIGVTLEVERMERPNREGAKTEFGEPQDNGEERPSGERGYTGERGGGRKRSGGGELKRGEKLAPLNFWFKVRLAEFKKL
jgi:hypothetical protein